MKLCLLSMCFLVLTGMPFSPLQAKEIRPGSTARPWVEDVLKTNPGVAPDTAKFFFLAGSSLTANFAQEIVDQMQIWRDKGVRDSEMACYYVVPTQGEFEEEAERYLLLASQLRNCFPANVQQLRLDLKRVAKKNPTFIYLYLTSHGRQPISEKAKVLMPQDPNYDQYHYLARFEVLDQYSLDVEGLPDGPAGPYELLGAYRGGMDPEDIFLTPGYLLKFLNREFSNTPKYLVLQGCFTGGFLVDPRKERWDGLLTNLKKVMVLTAAQHNRESFGCGPGSDTTYFGGAYNQTLKRMGKLPPMIDWFAFQATLKELVATWEKKMQIQEPSHPIYFSNQKGKVEFF
jgi:hypothetical protein